MTKEEQINKEKIYNQLTELLGAIDKQPKNLEVIFSKRQLNIAEEAKKRYENATKEPHAKASACVQCGQCEVQCPQHIEIRSWLKRVSEVLE